MNTTKFPNISSWAPQYLLNWIADCCRYWGDFRRAFEMTKLTQFDRCNSKYLHQHKHVNIILYDCLRHLHGTVYIYIYRQNSFPEYNYLIIYWMKFENPYKLHVLL